MSKRKPVLVGHLRHRRHAEEKTDEADEDLIEIDPGMLNGFFASPKWMRDLGYSSWLLVGVAAALVGTVWLLSLTQVIVMPVIVAAVIASVTAPLVDWFRQRGIPRGLGAGLVFLGIIAIGAAVCLMILLGIASQADSLSEKLREGAGEIESWLRDLGASAQSAANAGSGADSSISAGFQALTRGLLASVDQLASLAIFLSFTALSLFFMLKDAPTIGGFIESHMGVPRQAAKSVLSRVASSLRGYFLGVTVVAAWSATIVGIGALLLGVPLAGTIAVVTFAGGYIPYLGAWAAGVFAVLIALGGSGAEVAMAMILLVLLANGLLQQLVQPIAYGAALNLHPLVVLIVTIAGGALFGTVGLVLAAPLLSAAVKIKADLSAHEDTDHERAEPEPSAEPDPAPA